MKGKNQWKNVFDVPLWNEGIKKEIIPGQSTTNESSITLQVEPFRNFELKDDFRTCSIASSPTESSAAQIALRYNSLIYKTREKTRNRKKIANAENIGWCDSKQRALGTYKGFPCLFITFSPSISTNYKKTQQQLKGS